MFCKQYGRVRIEQSMEPKRGNCLKASCGDKYILMDYCGANPMLVPDGTNAYLFGNKLILVTRWSDMDEDERGRVQTDPLCLLIMPYAAVQFALRVGSRWGDVMVNLYHCIDGWNDESMGVDEAIFIFADTHDSDFVVERSVEMPEGLQVFLREANRKSRGLLRADASVSSLKAEAEADRSRDLYDYLYDFCYDRTKGYARDARAKDPGNVPGGIYMEIDGGNTVTELTQRPFSDDAPAESEADRDPEQLEATASEEVKLYHKLALRGIADGMYNLGVCYESGDGVRMDPRRAFYWYKRAADLGYAKAQYNLGICQYKGFGTAADFTAAAKSFRAAAEQGDMYAEFSLGVCLYKGEGVKQDIGEAMGWFRKAAEQGHPQAKQITGI